MKYPVVELGDICDEIYRYPSFYGMEHFSTGVPVIRGEHIDAWGSISQDWNDYWFVSKEVSSRFPRTVLREGDLVFTVRGTIGKVGLITKSHDGAQLSPNLIRFSPKSEVVDTVFLWYFLQSIKETAAADIQNEVTIASVRASDLSELKIPLPPLTEQKRIASLLRRADRLRQLRRTAHDLGDALLQSVFLEMFGDLGINSMGWDFYELDELDLYISDGNYSSKYPRADEFVSKGIPFIRANNLKNHTVIWDDMRYITPEKHELLKKGHIRTDDLLITTRGNIGLVGLVPSDFDDANINAQLVLIRCKGTKLAPRYLLWVLQTPKIREQFDYLQTGTALQQLPVGNLVQLEIPVPPLSLQEEFAGVVARVESLRGRMGESERQVEGLFESLLNEAFNQ